MPLSNWAGWFGVSLIIMIGYEWLGGGLSRTDRRAPIVYGVNCLFPILLCLLYGLYVAFVAGLLAAAVPYAFLYAKRRS
jgi:putative membrane protein